MMKTSTRTNQHPLAYQFVDLAEDQRLDEAHEWECAPKTGQISSKIENRPIGAFQVHELLELDRRTIAD